jgi:hypothetical protein
MDGHARLEHRQVDRRHFEVELDNTDIIQRGNQVAGLHHGTRADGTQANYTLERCADNAVINT